MERRAFLQQAALAGAAAALPSGPVLAQGTGPAARTIDTSTLSIAYEDDGDPRGVPDHPAARLSRRRPRLRRGRAAAGQGGASRAGAVPARLRPDAVPDAAAPRMAEQAAIGQDVIDFADALQLPRFAVAGYDWGGRAAAIAAALHPERVRAAVLIGGYTDSEHRIRRRRRPRREAEHRAWYQWYFNTERGRAGLRPTAATSAATCGRCGRPSWTLQRRDFDRTAPSFDNPDFVDVVIHSYRHRIGNAPGEPRFEDVEAKLAARPRIQAPSITLTAATMASPGRHWSRRRPSARSSRSWSRAAWCRASGTSCRAKNQRRFRRRCWSCWRRIDATRTTVSI